MNDLSIDRLKESIVWKGELRVAKDVYDEICEGEVIDDVRFHRANSALINDPNAKDVGYLLLEMNKSLGVERA